MLRHFGSAYRRFRSFARTRRERSSRQRIRSFAGIAAFEEAVRSVLKGGKTGCCLRNAGRLNVPVCRPRQIRPLACRGRSIPALKNYCPLFLEEPECFRAALENEMARKVLALSFLIGMTASSDAQNRPPTLAEVQSCVTLACNINVLGLKLNALGIAKSWLEINPRRSDLETSQQWRNRSQCRGEDI